MSDYFNRPPDDTNGESGQPDHETAEPVFDAQAMDGLTAGHNVVLAASEFLGMSRADIEDMLAVTEHDNSLRRLLDVMAVVGRAQAGTLQITFTRIYGELMRMNARSAAIPDASPNGVQFTVVRGESVVRDEATNQDVVRQYGALVVSEVQADGEDQIRFALIGYDPANHNVLDQANSALLFVDDALMPADRMARAREIGSQIADLQGFGVDFSTEDGRRMALNDLAQGWIFGEERAQVRVFEGSTAD